MGKANPFETRVVGALLKEGDVFVDVGANAGWFRLNAAHLVGPTGVVYAFEPNPGCARQCQASCELNGFEKVVVEQCAVSDVSGQAQFWLGRDDVVSSLIKENAEREDKGAIQSIMVPTTTLDEYVRDHAVTKIKLIKIDVEGSELFVIRGAAQTLAELSPYLMVEWNAVGLGRGSVEDGGLRSYLD